MNKNIMNKVKNIGLSLVIAGVCVVPAMAMAYTPQAVVFDPGSNVERNTGLGNASPTDVAAGIINWVLGLLMIISVILIIYGGFIWMFSRGNEEQVTKAKDILTGALIGAVIILASYGASYYVFENLLNATVNGVA